MRHRSVNEVRVSTCVTSILVLLARKPLYRIRHFRCYILVLFFLSTLPELLGIIHLASNPSKSRQLEIFNSLKAVVSIGGTILGLSLGILTILGLSYFHSLDHRPPLHDVNSGDLPSIAKVASQTTTGCYCSFIFCIRTMLDSLTGTEGEIESAKKHLRETVANLAQQEQAATDASTRVKDLSEREDEIKQKIQQAESILGGQHIITVDDLNNSESKRLVVWFWVRHPGKYHCVHFIRACSQTVL